MIRFRFCVCSISFSAVGGGMAAEEEEPCCTSHAFDCAARRDPALIAAIHASNRDRPFACGDLLCVVSLLSLRIAAMLPRPSTAHHGDNGSLGV